MTLTDDQALLMRAITWPTGVADFLAHSDASTRSAFARAFADTPAFDRVARVGVYAEGYFWRLHGVLADHFELVAWLCGPARFRNLATDYVLACPPLDPDIRRYGERFPGFVATHGEGARVVGLADVAAIEWAMVRALDAPDERAATQAELRAVPLAAFPALELRAVATARVHACALPFSTLWRAHEDMPAPTEPPRENERPIDVLVWRAGFDVLHRELDGGEAGAVRALVRGVSFAELCDRVASAEVVVAWLQRWLADGLIAA
jgi:hypothetical protein